MKLDKDAQPTVTATKSAQSPTTGDSVQRKSLRGMDYASGTALLSPDVQMKADVQLEASVTKIPRTIEGTASRDPLDLADQLSKVVSWANDAAESQETARINQAFEAVNQRREGSFGKTDTYAEGGDKHRGLKEEGYQGRLHNTGKRDQQADGSQGLVGHQDDPAEPTVFAAELANTPPPTFDYARFKDDNGKPIWLARYGYPPNRPNPTIKPIWTAIDQVPDITPGVSEHKKNPKTEGDGAHSLNLVKEPTMNGYLPTQVWFTLHEDGSRHPLTATTLNKWRTDNAANRQMLVDYENGRLEYIADWGHLK